MVSTFGLTVGSHGQPTNDQESGSTLVVKKKYSESKRVEGFNKLLNGRTLLCREV